MYYSYFILTVPTGESRNFHLAVIFTPVQRARAPASSQLPIQEWIEPPPTSRSRPGRARPLRRRPMTLSPVSRRTSLSSFPSLSPSSPSFSLSPSFCLSARVRARGGAQADAGVGRRRPVTLSRPLPDLPLLSSPLPFLSLSSSYLSLLGFVRDEGTGVCTACGTRGLGCVGCGRGAWMGQILSHPGAAYPANTDTRRAHQSLDRKMNRGVKII